MATAGTPPAGTQSSGSAPSVQPPPELRRRKNGPIIAIIIVVVLIIAGVGLYAGGFFGSHVKKGVFSVSSYSSFSTANTNQPITFYAGASVPASNISSITWNFGNGYSKTYSGSTGTSVSYPYPYPGSYLVQATVITKNNTEASNALALIPITITPSSSNLASAAKQYPASISISDSSSTGKNVTYGFTSVVGSGGYVNVTSQLPASFSINPSASGWSLKQMTISVGSKKVTFNATDVSNGVNFVNYTFASTGLFPITIAAVTNNSTSTSTWTYVQTAAVGALSPRFPSSTAHTGIVDSLWFPGGFATMDPAVGYDTASYEVMYNLYSPLVQYTPGSSTSSFIPVISTQVPTAKNGLLQSATAGGITYTNYTFPINTAEKFADGNHITPYDVYFSIVRTLLFANDPGRPGWLLAHALIPGASIYGPFNITPYWINKAMTYNATSITFHILPTTNLSLFGISPSAGTNAAYFATGTSESNTTALAGKLAASEYDSEGAAVYFMQILTQPPAFVLEPSWANSSGAGIGAFTNSTFFNYQQYGNPSSWNTNLQFGSMGTGPYVVKSVSPGNFISFTPNPNYVQPDSSYPAPSALEPSITLYYYTSQSVAQQAFASGASDFAELAYPPTSTPALLPMIHSGQANIATTLQLSYFAWFFNMQTNVTGLSSLTTQPVSFPQSSLLWENNKGVTSANAAGSWEVSNFFGNLSTRKTFSYAFNQAEYIQKETNSGIVFAQNQTGYLPAGIANGPTNMTNLSTNPYTPYLNTALAEHYWSQTPWASLPAGSVKFPIFSITGNPIQDQMVTLWTATIKNVTNGIVQPYLADVTFSAALSITATAAGHMPLPVYWLGWIDDYPDPTDFAAPMAQAYGIYSYPDGLFQGPGFNTTTHPDQWKMINNMWNVTALAAGELNNTLRSTYYWQSDNIYNQLYLQAGAIQEIGIVYYRTSVVQSSLAFSLSPEASLSFLILFPVQSH